MGIVITVEAILEIAPDQTLRIGLPESVRPGLHRVVVLIEESLFNLGDQKPERPLRLSKLHLASWPKNCTFRREDIYGDSGR